MFLWCFRKFCLKNLFRLVWILAVLRRFFSGLKFSDDNLEKYFSLEVNIIICFLRVCC